MTELRIPSLERGCHGKANLGRQYQRNTHHCFTSPMSDLTPEHTLRQDSKELHPEIVAAYAYVDSVVKHADATSPLGGFAWHGWAVREAFLAGCSHARSTLLSQPQPPAGEVGELVKFLRDWGDDYADEGTEWHRAADLLERLAQPPKPIPVSERLPRPEDCDAEGRCWAWDVCSDSWVLHPAKVVGSVSLKSRVTHWLPAHALPLPSGEGDG